MWQPRPGAWSLTVVGKATYALQPGESPLAEEQEAPNEVDTHWDDDPSRSLHTVGDLVPFKKRAEVILVGHAYAPEGRPVSSLRARLVVGDVDKSIEIVADRAFTLDGQLVEGPPFTRMALRWERASGGPGTANPVGLRADARPDVRGRVPLPNLQRPGTYITRPGEFVAPINFGPLAPTWPDRWQRLSRVPGWDPGAWTQSPLPADLDAAFFNAAPRDQQIDVLRSNERLVLENLHPQHARLVTNLAPLTPAAEVDWGEGAVERFAMRCDTMIIDTDRGRCTLTWRSQIPIDYPTRRGRVTLTTAPPGPRAGALGDATRGEVRPRAPRTLPFIERAGTPPPAPPPAPDPILAGRTIDLAEPGIMPVLPFRVGRSPLAGTVLGAPQPAGPKAIEIEDEETTTDGMLLDPPTMDGLPARPVAHTLPFAHTAAAVQPQIIQPPIAQTLVVPPQVAPPQVAPPPAAPAWSAWSPPEPVAPPPVALPPVAPPPVALPPVAPPPVALPPVAPPEPEPEPAPEPPLPLPERFPIARTAAIAASLARRRQDQQAIFDENDIVKVDFDAVQRHWAKAVEAESRRGRRALLDAYDDAYVARLEEERGPITPAEYARIAIATERGGGDAALIALSLPREAAMRIERVWLRRIIADRDLARAVRRATAAAEAQEE